MLLPTTRSRTLAVHIVLAAAWGALTFTFAASVVAQCVGDCRSDGQVTVDEVIYMVNVALDMADVGQCLPGDGNADGKITIDEILLAVNHALSGCTANVTPAPTLTPTPTSSTTPVSECVQPTPQPTEPPPANCGNGRLDEGETCDDGNTTEDDITTGTTVDRCPYNCRIVSCGGAQSTLSVDVTLCIPTGVEAAGATLLLRYPGTTVGIPGSGNNDQVFDRIQNVLEDPFVSITPNDLDYALRFVAFSVDLVPLPAGRLFTVQFDVCAGAAVPAPADFRCLVKDASDPSGAPVNGVSCSVSVQ